MPPADDKQPLESIPSESNTNQEDIAVEAIQDLSLSTSSDQSQPPPASKFHPQPIVMSRGDSSSLRSTGSSMSDNNTKFVPAKDQHPLQEQEENGFATPPRNNNDPQIVLTANHFQHQLDLGTTPQKGTKNKNQRTRSDSPSSSGGSVLLAPITGAWGWFQKQKEKEKQRHLKELAEEQVQKLKEAQKRDSSINFTVVEEKVAKEENKRGGGCFEHKQSFGEDDSYYANATNNNNNNGNGEEQPDNEEEEDDISWIPPVRWVEEQVKKDLPPSPRNSMTSHTNNSKNFLPDPNKPVPFLLDPEQMHDIAKYVLPKGIAFCRWKRLYSLTRDGDSFFQCMRLCGTEPKTLLVLKTTRGALLGGYADAPWEVYSHQQGSFHGSAQACLFSFSVPKNGSNNDTPTKPQPNSNTNIHVFHWTGANRYIQFTDTSQEKRMLAFGGGGQEGAFGLCVEQDFQQGSTGPCDTFDNAPLCEQENFHIMDLEIWGFLTGQF